MHTGVGVILLNSKNQVLLILRDDFPTIPFPNHWDLPGGHVEPGETPEECLQREMQEEMELVLSGPKLFHSYSWPDFNEYIYWQRLDLDLKILPLHEGQRAEYFSIENLPQLKLAFKSKEVIPEFFREVVL